MVLRHRCGPAGDLHQPRWPARADDGRQLLPSQGHELVVVEQIPLRIECAAEEHPEEDMAVGGAPRKLRAGKTDRQRPPPLDARHHHTGGIERMGDLLAGVPEDDDGRTRVFDAGKLRGERIVCRCDHPGRDRRRQRHDHSVGLDRRRATGPRHEDHAPPA